TLYAKYDYLISWVLTGSGTVTDGKITEQPYVSVDLYLKSFRYNKVKGTTLNKIKIEFSLDLWEEDEGYQDFYLYNGEEIVWSYINLEHGGGSKNTTPARYFFKFELNLLEYDNVDETLKTRAGKELYNNIENLELYIRERVTQPFIMRGTYHELANRLQVGWHIDFYERLHGLLKENSV
ncbi:MAG: hypothetical protein K2J67_02945, partial [Lachnospiraceae bacterium]|nr:hypothetical protein [Lachnospiraceae bacterium]